MSEICICQRIGRVLGESGAEPEPESRRAGAGEPEPELQSRTRGRSRSRSRSWSRRIPYLPVYRKAVAARCTDLYLEPQPATTTCRRHTSSQDGSKARQSHPHQQPPSEHSPASSHVTENQAEDTSGEVDEKTGSQCHRQTKLPKVLLFTPEEPIPSRIPAFSGALSHRALHGERR